MINVMSHLDYDAARTLWSLVDQLPKNLKFAPKFSVE